MSMEILILEDNGAKLAEMAAVLQRATAGRPTAIKTVGTASDARGALAATAVDLLVLDLVVPETLGDAPDPQAGRRLLEDLFEGEELRMPAQILAVTGYDEIAVTQAADFAARGVTLVKYTPGVDSWRTVLEMAVRHLQARQAALLDVPRGYQSRVGVICALDVEFAAVERLPYKWRDASQPGDPQLYLRGTMRDQEGAIVAALCPRMGMAAAAVTATKMIERFRPEIIAIVGITAGVRNAVNIGDVLVAEECWDWGMGKWIAREGQTVFVAGPHHLSIDAELRAKMLRMSRDSTRLAAIREGWPSLKPDTALAIRIGPVASGAAVISTQDMSDHVKAQHRKLIGIEMEAYGVYAAADEATRPSPRAIAIKAVCDLADDQKNDAWHGYAAYAAATVFSDLVEAIS